MPGLGIQDSSKCAKLLFPRMNPFWRPESIIGKTEPHIYNSVRVEASNILSTSPVLLNSAGVDLKTKQGRQGNSLRNRRIRPTSKGD